ncbi:BRO-N domain-containing protein [Streptococcus intermedius]
MELQIINEQEVLGKHFTVYGTADEPLFVAKDIAEWIEYDLSSVNKMLDKIDEDEKLVGTLFRSGQNREVWFLTENGLYEVLMQSRKPLAKEFKKKVKEIVEMDVRSDGY